MWGSMLLAVAHRYIVVSSVNCEEIVLHKVGLSWKHDEDRLNADTKYQTCELDKFARPCQSSGTMWDGKTAVAAVMADVDGDWMSVLIHFTKIGSYGGELSSHMLRCSPPPEVRAVWEGVGAPRGSESA